MRSPFYYRHLSLFQSRNPAEKAHVEQRLFTEEAETH